MILKDLEMICISLYTQLVLMKVNHHLELLDYKNIKIGKENFIFYNIQTDKNKIKFLKT